ncbi:MAG TPA: aspartate aminotransferase family protein [Ruminococcaceae bacterium]|nr:aspartate aminotransferase family protein [Oscillospiraceae bacterium]
MMNEYRKRVKKILPGGVHYNFNIPWEESPLHFVKTKDSRVWDMDGKEYLDLYARFGSMILGHGEKEYLSELKALIDRALSVSHCDLDAEALELISRFVPCAEMVRFGVSGTEIVQNAIRLARAYTGKEKIVRFENHYHGNADNIMGGKTTKSSPLIPCEYKGDTKGTLGRGKDALTQGYLLPWNNPAALEQLLDEHHGEIATVITEPVCVNGGSVMPAEGYLQKMRELCSKYNVVLIFDEIITGFRMNLGGAQAEFGIIPDLTTLGKAIAGGGLPVSALAGKRAIMSLLTEKKVVHAGTFNGYPLGTAAVKATLEILSRNGGAVYKAMNGMALKMRTILEEEAEKVGLPLITQGPPSCGAYHCCEKVLSSPSEYTANIMMLDAALNSNLASNGILISSISRIYPNISLNDNDVEWFRERVGTALKETKSLYDELNWS